MTLRSSSATQPCEVALVLLLLLFLFHSVLNLFVVVCLFVVCYIYLLLHNLFVEILTIFIICCVHMRKINKDLI